MKVRTGSLIFIFFSYAAVVLFAPHDACAQVPARGRPSSGPATPSGPPGKVFGTVRRLDDGAPLKKAQVTLAPEGRQQEALAVRTDSNGKFEFLEVAPGRYQVRAQRNGYVAQVYGQRGSGPGLTITVEPGRTVEKIEVRLERAGVISGMVIDEDSEPVEGVEVRAMRVRYMPGGRERLIAARTARTDDLGNYRIPGLTPGMYYVQAGGRGDGVRIGGPNMAVGYGVTFYPGVSTREEAQLLQVTSGNETGRVELSVRTTPTYSISGVVADSKPASATRRYGVGFTTGSSMGITSMDRGDGSFVLRGVEPGDYTLVAQAYDPDGAPRFGYRSVRVANADVNVVIEIGAAASVQGEVRAEDSSPINFKEIMVSLQSLDDRGGTPSGVIDEKGHFAVSNVVGGRYNVALATRDRDYYLKEARCRGQDALVGALTLNASETVDDCTLKIAHDTGRITGFVKQDDRPVEGMAVVLIPVEYERRKIPRNTALAQTDVNGGFDLRGVVPGEYYAFAVAPSDDAIYYQLEFADRNRENATKISVKPNDLQSVELKLAKVR